ncbi:16S rRNA methyltransferase [Fervidicella metallireducens AeB]|uniref:Ribosomal RNA small subunit methyltransferase A n=1 Tax=Fervidicella metallireducens AeB TaxID=1403537 RepID=A0A017RZC8_9CLOT|nr:16S rRNA (adenine(1518)-N(6)/adenine(1519)-N(6))-dimethyltransferase RsmA [Fervidicella metallireducens]EYE89759.1 16S rRNA methyltransferase [Fervidicella metallireducens AeB]
MSLSSKTKEIVKHFEFKFSKNFGQNFLIDQNVLDNIINAAQLSKDTCAIEIGPGIGTLTQEMAKRSRKVVTIEIDDTLIPVLNETLSDFDNIKILHEDAMKIDFNKLIMDEGLESPNLVANLPYYITTPIITKILTENTGINRIVIMIQKEVADRIVAKPDTKEYGALSLLCQYYSDVSKICKVPPSSFIPQPKVESAVIKMDIRKEPSVKVADEKLFFRIIRDSFNMRRKTLWNTLKQLGIEEEKLKEALEEAGIDPKRRGETLSIEEFGKLSDCIKNRM